MHFDHVPARLHRWSTPSRVRAGIFRHTLHTEQGVDLGSAEEHSDLTYWRRRRALAAESREESRLGPLQGGSSRPAASQPAKNNKATTTHCFRRAGTSLSNGRGRRPSQKQSTSKRLQSPRSRQQEIEIEPLPQTRQSKKKKNKKNKHEAWAAGTLDQHHIMLHYFLRG